MLKYQLRPPPHLLRPLPRRLPLPHGRAVHRRGHRVHADGTDAGSHHPPLRHLVQAKSEVQGDPGRHGEYDRCGNVLPNVTTGAYRRRTAAAVPWRE